MEDFCRQSEIHQGELKELKTQIESDEISYKKKLNLGIEPDIIIEAVARRYKKNSGKLVNGKTRHFYFPG